MTQEQIKAVEKLLIETDKTMELFWSEEMTKEFVEKIGKIMGWV